MRLWQEAGIDDEMTKMAAISTAVLALCPPGGRIVAQTVHYGGALAFLQQMAPRFGAEVAFIDQARKKHLTLADFQAADRAFAAKLAAEGTAGANGAEADET